jgi:hypothetical protein
MDRQMGWHETKKLRHSQGKQQSEEADYGMKENICNPKSDKGLIFKTCNEFRQLNSKKK